MTKNRRDATVRLVGVAANGIAGCLAAKGHSRLGAKRRMRPGSKRKTYEREELRGTDFSREGRMVQIERIIDHAKDRYSEKVTDEDTGSVLRDVDEPLSRHTGRGSARKK